MDINLHEVIEGCKNNNRKYQEMLYNIYYKKLYSWLLSDFGDAQLTEEIMNDAFLRIFKGIHLYEYKGNFEGWMRKISKRALYDYIKRNRNYLKGTTLTDKIVDRATSNSPDAKIDYKLTMSKMAKLPNKTRQVLLMYLDGYTHKEIGIATNISEGTSKWHVNDSKNRLKGLIKELI